MKFCDRHWKMAKDAIAERGLDRDLATTGEEALARATAGRDDPLMKLHWMITGRATEMLGPWLLMVDEDGADRCPQCEISKACTCGVADCADAWTPSAADALAKELAAGQA